MNCPDQSGSWLGSLASISVNQRFAPRGESNQEPRTLELHGSELMPQNVEAQGRALRRRPSAGTTIVRSGGGPRAR